MTDYSEHGAQPVEDAAVEEPPTVDEVLERQRREHPGQVPGSTTQHPLTPDEAGAVDAGGTVVDERPEGGVDVEGPNPA